MNPQQRAAAATLKRGAPVRGAGWTNNGSYGGFIGTVTSVALPRFIVTADSGLIFHVNIAATCGYTQWISPIGERND